MSKTHGARRRVEAAWKLIEAKEEYEQTLEQIANEPSSSQPPTDVVEQELEYTKRHLTNAVSVEPSLPLPF